LLRWNHHRVGFFSAVSAVSALKVGFFAGFADVCIVIFWEDRRAEPISLGVLSELVVVSN